MKVIIIAAHDPNLVIGKDGTLPWRYPGDLAFFKQKTMGHPLLMGRIVFEELNETPLPGREAIVLSKTKSYGHVPTFTTIQEALDYLSSYEKVFVIGGGDVYRQTLELADQLIITEIKQQYDGDTFFPEYRDKIGKVWEEISREEKENYAFVEYHRKRE